MIRLALPLLLVTACVDETNLGNQRSVPFTPSVRWVTSLHPLENQMLRDIAMDSAGDVVAVSRTNPSPPIGSYITKRAASDGSERWTRRLNPQGGEVEILGLAIDANDNIVVTGAYQGTPDFGGQQLSVGLTLDTFIAKYSPEGELLWVRGLSASALSMGESLEIAADGTIYLMGSYRNAAITLAGESHPWPMPADNNAYAFILALDANGADLWGRTFEADITDLAFANNGDLIVTGAIFHRASVGGPVLTPAGYYDTFVSRFRTDGTYVTSRALGRAETSPYGQTLVQPGGSIVLRVFGIPNTDPNTLVALDDSLGDLWTAHTKYGAFTQDEYSTVGARITSTDSPDDPPGKLILARIDDGVETSAVLGTTIAASPPRSVLTVASTDGNGAVVFGGEHTGTFDFGTGPITGNGDLLLVVVDPSPPPSNPTAN